MDRIAACTDGFAQGVRATLGQFPKGSSVDLKPILDQMKCDGKRN